MAAVADEVLLHGPAWPGQEAWPATLLEEALYGSRIAGERIFRTAHDLVESQPRRSGVAVSILLALMLGFRGRYHGNCRTQRKRQEQYCGRGALGVGRAERQEPSRR